MADLADFKGNVRGGSGWMSYGWPVAFTALLAFTYFLFEFQDRKNATLSRHITVLQERADALQALIERVENTSVREHGSLQTTIEQHEEDIMFLQAELVAIEEKLPKKKTRKSR